jgi:hypothetical protein
MKTFRIDARKVTSFGEFIEAVGTPDSLGALAV